MALFNRSFIFFLSTLLTLLICGAMPAAAGVDGFDPNVDGTVSAVAVQKDGKILIGGGFSTVGGITRNELARLNPDGSLDGSFNPNPRFYDVSCITLQDDGKILIGGGFTSVGGYARTHLARLNPDGSVDAGFDVDLNGSVEAISVQKDGRVIIAGAFNMVNGENRPSIARLQKDGAVDDSFIPSVSGYIHAVALQADGGVLIAGEFGYVEEVQRSRFARLNADGTLDRFFDPMMIANGTISGAKVQPDGRILIWGGFTEVGGVPNNRVARLNADGTPDATFSNALDPADQVYSVTLQANGKLLVCYYFTDAGGVTRDYLARLNSDGSVDGYASLIPNNRVLSVALQPDGKALIGGFFTAVNGTTRNRLARVNVDGTLERTFDPNANSSSLYVFSTATQPDHKVVVTGSFTSIGGVLRKGIARLNPDGSVEASFDPSSNGYVNAASVQPGGEILIGGYFSKLGAVTRNNVARLNADGSLDPSFDPNANSEVGSVTPLPDGRAVLAGWFTTVGGVTRNYIARIDAGGALDGSFDPNANAYVTSTALQNDGRIVMVGNFTTVGGAAHGRVARVNQDGTPDSGFNPSANDVVRAVAVQPDGKILIGGLFTNVNGTAVNRLARLNPDGSLDSSFSASVLLGYVRTIALQQDGKIVIGGSFTSVNGATRNRIARLNADGSLDASFNPNASDLVRSIELLQDGSMLIAGDFSSVGGQTRNYLARIGADSGGVQSLEADADLGTVTWLRSGEAPEVEFVTFEGSGDNATWSPLGNGARIAGGWRLAGAALSRGENLYLRARGIGRGGQYSGSATLLESLRQVFLPPAPPVALPASGIGSGGFTANWEATPGALGYFLDVATDSGFTSFRPGYQGKNVGGATSAAVSGLYGGNFYYRVRAYNAGSVSLSSDSVTVTVQDTTAPSTTPSPLPGTYLTPQTVILSCSDIGGSGCDQTWYCLGAGCTPATLYDPAGIPVSEPGIISFYSRDRAGNSEPVQSAAYNIDGSALQLHVTITGSGIGSVQGGTISCTTGSDLNCGGLYGVNDTVLLTATPSPDSMFGGWTGCSWISGNQCSVTLQAAANVTANFFSMGPTGDQLASGDVNDASINSLGETVWSQWDPATGKNQIFSSLRGQITSDAVSHYTPAINALGDLAWVQPNDDQYNPGYYVKGIVGGRPVTLGYSRNWIARVDLNDRGEAVWSSGDDSNVSQIYSSRRGKLTSAGTDSINPGINNQGDVVFIRVGGGEVPTRVMKLSAGSTEPVTVTEGFRPYAGTAINDAGEMVWGEGLDTSSGGIPAMSVVSSVRGVLTTMLDDARGVDLNNCGDVVYSSFNFGSPTLFRLGQNSPCASYPGDHGTLEQAAQVSFGAIFTGAVGGSAPVNWYRFDASSGDTVRVSANIEQQGAGAVSIGLYDAQGSLLSGPTATSPVAIGFPASYTGSYYLKVAGEGGPFGYSVSLSKYTNNCGAGPCPDLLASGSFNGGSINSLGEAVWSQFDPATGYNQIFSSLRGQLTHDAFDHLSPSINNLGDLVWGENHSNDPFPEPFMYKVSGIVGGRAVTLASSERQILQVDINDRGEAVWSSYDGSNFSQIYSSVRGQLTSGSQNSMNPSINNRGDVVFVQSDYSGTPPTLYKIAAGATAAVAVTGNPVSSGGAAINDAGEVVWTERDSANFTSRIVSSVRGTVLTVAGDLGSVDLNNCGDLAYQSYGFDGPTLYRLGQNAPCVSYPGSHATREEAAQVSFGEIFTGVSDSVTAVSWYRFDASSGDTVHLAVNYDNRAPNTLAIGLYDAQGNLLSGPTSTSPLGISFPASYTGSYYLKLEGAGGRFGYSVSLSKYSNNCGAGPCPELVTYDGMSGSSMNSLGEIVWSQSDPASGFLQVFSSLRGQLTSDAVHHYAPAINNLGDLVWAENNDGGPFPEQRSYRVKGIVAGRPVTVAVAQGFINQLDINDRGEAVWTSWDSSNLPQLFSSLRGQLSSGSTSSYTPSINNRGDIVFTQLDNGRQKVYRIAAGSRAAVEVAGDGIYGGAAINDAGEILYSQFDEASTPPASRFRLVSSARGTLAALGGDPGPVDLNNCGDLTYVAYGYQGPYLYRLGQNAPCASYSGSHATREEAAQLSLGDIFTGVTDSGSAPVSWYRFEASSGDTVRLTVNYDNRAPNTLAVGLYDAQGSLLTGPTAASPLGISFPAPYTGSYYLKLEGTAGRFGYGVSLSKYTNNCGAGPCPDLLASGSIGGVSINSLGEVVWSQFDPVTGYDQIFSSLRGQLTNDQVNHFSPSLNNMGDLVWAENSNDPNQQYGRYKVMGIVGGTPVTVAIADGWISKVDLNDRGEAVWSSNDGSNLSQIHSSVRGQLTSGSNNSWTPSINNYGDIVFTQSPLDGSASKVYTILGGTTTPVLSIDNGSVTSGGAAVSDAREVIWTERDRVTSLSSIVSSLGRVVVSQPGDFGFVDLNSCGDVVYLAYTYDGPALYRLGQNAPCATNSGSHDTMEQAAPVWPGDIFTGVADSGSPVSWYRFEAASGDNIHVTVNYDSRPPNALTIGLYDGQGSLLSGPTAASPLAISIPASYSGNYYLKLEGAGGRFGYSVSLSNYTSNCGAGPCPDLLASANVQPSVSLNSLGEAVWSQFDPQTGYNQVFSSLRGQLTVDYVDHYSPALNNVGDLVWAENNTPNDTWWNSTMFAVKGIVGGQLKVLATADSWIGKVDLNDRGEVVWSSSDRGGVNQIYSNLRGQLTSGALISRDPAINNAGDVVFTQYDPNGGPLQVMKLSGGVATQVATVAMATANSGAAINDAGEVVWGEWDPVSSTRRVVSSARGVVTTLSGDIASVDLNNCGDLAYGVYTANGPAIYRLGQNAPCASYPGSHDSQGGAAAVSFGDIFTGAADSGATSWYRFEASSGDAIRIAVSYDNRGSSALEIGLYDGQGNLLSGPTSTAPLGITSSASYSGSYFLKVTAQGGRIGYSVSLGKYANNCGAGPCPEIVVKDYVHGSSINSLGEVVWSQWDSETQNYQVFSSLRGRLTSDAVSHDSPAVNNLGDVVWSEWSATEPHYLVKGIIGGQNVTLASSASYIYKVDFNDLGEAVWSANVGNFTQIFSSVRGQLTSEAVNSTNPSINNKGDLVFTRGDGDPAATQVIRLRAGSSTPETVVPGNVFSYGGVSINDSGEIVWGEWGIPGYPAVRVISSVRGLLTSTTSDVTWIDVNNCGDVVYSAADLQGPVLYRLGQSSPCMSYQGGNDSQEQAAAVSFGESFTGVASGSSSVQWYRMDAGAGDTIKIDANFDNRGSNTLAIGLYDGQGNLVSGPTSTSPLGIQSRAPYSGSYYLKVEGEGGRFGWAVALKKSAALTDGPFKLVLDGQSDSYFATLAEFFSGAPAAAELKLFCRSGDFSEDLVMNRCDQSLTVSGGYDTGFAASSGTSRINGTLKVSCGKVVADGIVIR